MKASAIANANIALVKYWGKRNKTLKLPYNSSISMTTEGLMTHTTIEFSKEYKEDLFILNGKTFKKGSKEYDDGVGRFLNVVRKKAGIRLRAKIMSYNNFPTAAGLASSAAGFAALALAVNQALCLNLNKKELSILARRGSGSASRSIFGGFVEWKKGKRRDGLDSYAHQIVPADYWQDFRMIICITSSREKKVSSRTGMERTVRTSPMYKAWLKTIDQDIKRIKKGIKDRNFTLVGETAQENCLKMHALTMTSKPSIFYWNSTTIDLINRIIEWKNQGIECYFTIDAGPQVKIICLEKDIKKIIKRCRYIKGVEKVIVTRPGRGARITNKHLF